MNMKFKGFSLRKRKFFLRWVMAARRARGFTLVELLVVIAIIGILVGLLVPAVEMAQEAGRRATCSNNVKQLALGCLQHLQVQGHFPIGGWGNTWVGMPERGFSLEQPGGWIFNVLPYIGEKSLHDLATGPGRTSTADDIVTRMTTPLPILHCPTRRKPALYGPQKASGVKGRHWQQPHPLIDLDPSKFVVRVAKNDFVINGGSIRFDHSAGPGSDVEGTFTLPPRIADTKFEFPSPVKSFPVNPPRDGVRERVWFSGLSFVHYPVREEQVIDGMSNTYLVGEKPIALPQRFDGQSEGDDENPYSGDDLDLVRWGRNAAMVRTYTNDDDEDNLLSFIPLSDTDVASVINAQGRDEWKLRNREQAFGSAHRVGFNMAFCDGSVRMINYGIDLTTHEYLASRNDRKAIDASKINVGR